MKRFLHFFLRLSSTRWFRPIEWALAAVGLSIVFYLWLSSPPMLTPVLTCVRADAWAHQGSLLHRYIGAHGGILLAYILIPIVAVVFLVLRGDIPLASAPVGLVAAFILSCGVGHGLEWLASYYPIYWLVANWHAWTAYISLVTWWFLLFHLVPILLALPSPQKHREALDAAELSALEAREAAGREARKNEELEKTKAALEKTQQDLRDALVETEAERDEARKNAHLAEQNARRTEQLNKDMARHAEQEAAAHEELRQQKAALEESLHTVARQQEAIRALSTPVLPILAHTIVAPIIGVFDSSRAAQLMETILAQISERSASLMILDVTGVPIVDTMVAKELTDIVEAASLMGCRCSITGIKGPVAQALVKLGVNFGPDVRTHTTLQQGMERALAEGAQQMRRSEK